MFGFLLHYWLRIIGALIIPCVVVVFIVDRSSGRCASPQLKDLFGLLKKKYDCWFEIGIAFGVDLAFRQSLKRDHGYSDQSRLEIVLNEWLTSSDSSNITWQEFMRVLREDLEYNDIVKETEKFISEL